MDDVVIKCIPGYEILDISPDGAPPVAAYYCEFEHVPQIREILGDDADKYEVVIRLKKYQGSNK